MHRLFVDVGYELSEPQLRYGPVSDVYLPKHSTSRNKGYAFVTFTSEQALSQALLDTQPTLSGIKVKVMSAISLYGLCKLAQRLHLEALFQSQCHVQAAH